MARVLPAARQGGLGGGACVVRSCRARRRFRRPPSPPPPQFGLCVDWRRSFITTPVNPFYDAFIRWQFNTLKKKGKIDFGKRPNIYSVKDAGVCGDHDRASGEGAAPQEYVLVKLKVLWDEELPVRAGASASPLQALKDAGEEVYLAPATLRPETMYAQTNCFVLPEGRYGAYRLADGSVFVVSARSASGLAHQDRCKVYGEMDCLCEFDGWDLLGLPLRPVNGIKYDRMYTLPLLTIKMDKGTGVVSSFFVSCHRRPAPRIRPLTTLSPLPPRSRRSRRTPPTTS